MHVPVIILQDANKSSRPKTSGHAFPECKQEIKLLPALALLSLRTAGISTAELVAATSRTRLLRAPQLEMMRRNPFFLAGDRRLRRRPTDVAHFRAQALSLVSSTMRFLSWSLVVAAFLTSVLAQGDSDDEVVVEEVGVPGEPELTVTASFPEDNPFGRAFFPFLFLR